MKRFLLECLQFCFSYVLKLPSVKISLPKSIFDLDEDFDSKEDLLLYYVTIKKN